MLTSYLLWYNYDVCKNPKYKRKLFGFFIALINLFGGYYEIKEMEGNVRSRFKEIFQY